MTESDQLTIPGLPEGRHARVPGPDDVPALVRLLAEHRRWARPDVPSGIDRESIRSLVVGPASWTRLQAVVDGEQPGGLVAAATVHDRAAGRTTIDLVVGPAARDADELASALLGWAADAAAGIARSRRLTATQLDSNAYALDERQQRWLAAAGYRHMRTWCQMTRGIEPGDKPATGAAGGASAADVEGRPPARPGVRVRQVRTHADGQPVARDLRTVHSVIEDSFADHFNTHRESLAEFVQRLREYPGHSWDQWWLAEADIDGEWVPGGALVGSVLPEDADGFEGSYIDYLGVTPRARGRGVARALLAAVIGDAALRGRSRVELEVDSESLTGAGTLYESMGWRTEYQTQSWHRDAPA